MIKRAILKDALFAQNRKILADNYFVKKWSFYKTSF
jgi:hypothetical protein